MKSVASRLASWSGTLVIGSLTFLGLPLLLLVWVPAVVWQMRRARRESRVLEDAFGDEYRRYRSRTWF